MGGCPAEQKNRNCSLCHRRLSRITDRCVFPTESQRECPKAGRGWVKGVLCFENPSDRWPPLHFRTMTLKLFYDHGPSGRSINQNTTYPGPWARAEWPVLLPLGEFIQYPWASISTSGKSGVRSDDLEFVPSLKPCISYHSSAFLFWRKTMWPAPLWPEWRIWHHFDGTQMREMVKHELMLKIKLCTVPSCCPVMWLASHTRSLSPSIAMIEKYLWTLKMGHVILTHELSRLTRAADRQSTSSPLIVVNRWAVAASGAVLESELCRTAGRCGSVD